MNIPEPEIIIFSGLTLSQQEIRNHLPYARVLPPATQGDLYRAYDIFKPKIIGLIDGFFESEPAVWHKEILYLLSQKVFVYGSSSMGALRAAELNSFGMLGVGKIFNEFFSGNIEDDDEVAVFHGPAEIDYPALSEAMVNIRATVSKAVHTGILDQETSMTIIRTAKKLFYKERTYERIFSLIRMDKSETKKLLSWLEEEKVDLKRLDAFELLNAIKADNRTGDFKPQFNFNNTIFWDSSKL